MHKTSPIFMLLLIIVIGGLLAAGGYFGFQKFDRMLELKAAQTRSEAIDGCASANRYILTQQTAEGTVTVEETSQGPFQKCLELKNIK